MLFLNEVDHHLNWFPRTRLRDGGDGLSDQAVILLRTDRGDENIVPALR